MAEMPSMAEPALVRLQLTALHEAAALHVRESAQGAFERPVPGFALADALLARTHASILALYSAAP